MTTTLWTVSNEIEPPKQVKQQYKMVDGKLVKIRKRRTKEAITESYKIECPHCKHMWYRIYDG